MILFSRKFSKSDRGLGYGKYDAGFPAGESGFQKFTRWMQGKEGIFPAEGESPAAKRKSFRENYFAGEFAYTGILLYTYFIKRPF